MAQYVYATTIFEIRKQAMQDAMTGSGRKRNQAEIVQGHIDDDLPSALLARASAILEWYLKDLPKTTLGNAPEQKL